MSRKQIRIAYLRGVLEVWALAAAAWAIYVFLVPHDATFASEMGPRAAFLRFLFVGSVFYFVVAFVAGLGVMFGPTEGTNDLPMRADRARTQFQIDALAALQGFFAQRAIDASFAEEGQRETFLVARLPACTIWIYEDELEFKTDEGWCMLEVQDGLSPTQMLDRFLEELRKVVDGSDRGSTQGAQ